MPFAHYWCYLYVQYYSIYNFINIYTFFTRISTVFYFFFLNNLYLYIHIDKLLEDTKAEVAEQEQHLALLKKEYEHFKAMLGQTQQARSKRSKNSTSFEMVSDVNNSTRNR